MLTNIDVNAYDTNMLARYLSLVDESEAYKVHVNPNSILLDFDNNLLTYVAYIHDVPRRRHIDLPDFVKYCDQDLIDTSLLRKRPYKKIDKDKLRRKKVSKEAQYILKSGCVILDTETTGLGDLDEICEISIIDGNDNILLDTLVQPTIGIPSNATRIHKITDEDVKHAPTFNDIQGKIENIINENTVAIYNASFDIRLLKQSAFANNNIFDIDNNGLYCIMKAYACYVGDWNDYYGNYRWHKLNVAASMCGYNENKFHRALSDCKASLHVLEHMSLMKD